MIGTQRTLGVGPPGSALLYVICSPVGPYYPTGFKAVSLEATNYAVRAWPGGVGNKKLGANYAPCIVPQMQAASRGFHQNLWLFGEDERVTEVGTMNFFVVLRDASGRKELVTARWTAPSWKASQGTQCWSLRGKGWYLRVGWLASATLQCLRLRLRWKRIGWWKHLGRGRPRW